MEEFPLYVAVYAGGGWKRWDLEQEVACSLSLSQPEIDGVAEDMQFQHVYVSTAWMYCCVCLAEGSI